MLVLSPDGNDETVFSDVPTQEDLEPVCPVGDFDWSLGPDAEDGLAPESPCCPLDYCQNVETYHDWVQEEEDAPPLESSPQPASSAGLFLGQSDDEGAALGDPASPRQSEFGEFERVDFEGPAPPPDLFSEPSDDEGAADAARKSVKMELVVEEFEMCVDPEREEAFAGRLTVEDRFKSVVQSMSRMMQDMVSMAYYTTKYSTKDNPLVAGVLPDQAIGVERLRRSEEEDRKRLRTRREWADFLLDAGRKTLIRLQTAANRASVKKLPEMVFQMYFGHECYMSHQTWTIFCKSLVWSAFKASRRRELLGPDCEWGRMTPQEKEMFIREKEENVRVEFPQADADEGGGMLEQPVERATLLVRKKRAGKLVFKALAKRQPADGEEPEEGGEEKEGKEDEEGSEEEVVLSGGAKGQGRAAARTFREGTEEQEPQPESQAVLALAPCRSQKLDWLHRGTCEPLASMGLLHYSMFVYTANVEASKVSEQDFLLYRFAETHPDCARRVQKLRLGEMYRVPRLFGFTMPRFDGSEEDKFRNASFKSVLMRPCAAPRDRYTDELEPYMSLVDSQGSFGGPWLEWFDRQRALAERCRGLEEQAGKVFTMEDIDTSLSCSQLPAPDQRRPSAAEFMANITIEVATNMELGAEARAGRRVGMRPEAGGLLAEGADLLAEHGVGGFDEWHGDDGPEPERVGRGVISKLYEARVPLRPDEVRRVACCDERPAPLVMAEYLKSFREGVGAALRIGAFTGHDAGGSGVQWRVRDSGAAVDATRIQEQTQEFEKWRKGRRAGGGEEQDVEDPARMRRDACLEPAAARWDSVMTPLAFVEEEMRKAGAREKKSIKFNKEQKDFLAFMTCKVQELLEAGYVAGAGSGQPDNEAHVPSVKPMRVFLGGPGGSGKSECVDIAGRLVKHFFAERSRQVLAASNSAARGVGGDTIHTGLFLSGQCSFRLSSKILSNEPSLACQETWAPVKALFLEEVSMISPAMIAGISYRLCRARRPGRPWLDDKLHEREDHMYGGIPIVVLLGDFMQLGAMERGMGRVSLIMDPKPSWHDECYVGRRIFWNGLTHVVMLRQTHRFKDEKMPRFLSYTRNPSGQAMPDDLKAMLSDWAVNDPYGEKVQKWRDRCASGGTEKKEGEESDCLHARGKEDAKLEPWHVYDKGIAWHAVQRLLQYRAARDAREKGQLLLYVQAVETCASQPLSHAEYRRALQVVNMNTTGKLLGYCPLFKGMRVRLCAKLSAQYGLVHDAAGEVMDFVLHERDQAECEQWVGDSNHAVYRAGYAQLKALPRAVLVKFDGVSKDFWLRRRGRGRGASRLLLGIQDA